MKINLLISKFFCRDIIKKEERKKISSKHDLIKEIRRYYDKNFSRNDLEIKLIDFYYIYNSIEKPRNTSIAISLMSIVLTLSLNTFNYVTTNMNQDKIKYSNEISRLENVKNTYWIKILEVKNEIEFTKDVEKKEQLEAYKESLDLEISIINQQMLNESENQISTFQFNVLNVLMNILTIYIIIQLGSILLSEVLWVYQKRKKAELKIKIEVVKGLISKSIY
ncbi:hypothetical protein [Clostridium tertium]|uniref:hypothetical protein n=1 Tax=Clostridium tertium TaxID=1559 RepID=UPI002A83F2AE|nr:hypothetical protein [Clostridium tertium]MDY4606389.1 hypothetical protein [Clostridium tertium]